MMCSRLMLRSPPHCVLDVLSDRVGPVHYTCLYLVEGDVLSCAVPLSTLFPLLHFFTLFSSLKGRALYDPPNRFPCSLLSCSSPRRCERKEARGCPCMYASRRAFMCAYLVSPTAPRMQNVPPRSSGAAETVESESRRRQPHPPQPPSASRGPTRGSLVPDNGAAKAQISGVARPSSSPVTSPWVLPLAAPAVVMPERSNGFFKSFHASFQPRQPAASADTPPPAAAAAPPVTDATNALSQHAADMLGDLVQWERELRDQLCRHEMAELTQLAHVVERVLLPVVPALREVSPLSLPQREQLGRWSLYDDYFQLLLDATELQEMLHRRALCTTDEPQQRRRIEQGEVPHWIEARRLQVIRENQASSSSSASVAQSEAQVQRLAYFKHVQQQLYQVFLLEESERADRMEVERLQRLHVGGLAEVIAKEYRRVRLCQLRYEAARLPLHPALSHEVAAAEGLQRSLVTQEQAHAFKGIQAAEVRAYLAQVR